MDGTQELENLRVARVFGADAEEQLVQPTLRVHIVDELEDFVFGPAIRANDGSQHEVELTLGQHGEPR
jgi:hypothetical protein